MIRSITMAVKVRHWIQQPMKSDQVICFKMQLLLFISGTSTSGGHKMSIETASYELFPIMAAKERPPLTVVGDVGGKIAIIVDDLIDEGKRIQMTFK
jgi:hypothetical protein